MQRFLFLMVALLPWTLANAQNFTEVAASMGITQTFGFGEFGGGVSFHDFNGDGWDDLTFCSKSGEPMYFFTNNNGVFQAITAPVNITDETKDATWVDYDNDGDKDLFVTVHNGINRLYRNDGNLNMTDVTLATFGVLQSNDSQGAVWGDVNRDGWLDLYVTNLSYEGNVLNNLWLNDGDGTFTDVTATSVTSEGVIPTFDAFFFDYNKDGWPDLYTSNDKYENSNHLYRNDGGMFTDVSAASGTNIAINSMNAGGADYDNDGDLDLYCSNTPEGNVCFRNNGDGTFTDVAGTNGTIFNRVGWASTFFDFNNDGWKDLYVSAMSDNIASEHNALYINQGNGTFTEPLRNMGGLGGSDYGSSLSHAIGDFNNDGRLDIAVSQVLSYPHLLWRNDETDTNNWIKINLSGVTSNREGVGSWIEIWAGNAYQCQYTHCSMGYLGQNSGNYHFGLGTATSIDSLKVTWPSGIVDKLVNINNLNTTEYVTEGDAALPVRLVAFNLAASGKKALLDWTTSEERGTERFDIERSLDGRTFQKIGWVQATGNSDDLKDYDYTDELLNGSTIYYRLKIVDFDGSFEYSPMRSIKLEEPGLVTDIFSVVELPENPLRSGNIRLSVETVQDGALSLELVSRVGQVLAQKQYATTTGLNELSFATTNLPTGSYFLRLRMGAITKSYQLVLVRD